MAKLHGCLWMGAEDCLVSISNTEWHGRLSATLTWWHLELEPAFPNIEQFKQSFHSHVGPLRQAVKLHSAVCRPLEHIKLFTHDNQKASRYSEYKPPATRLCHCNRPLSHLLQHKPLNPSKVTELIQGSLRRHPYLLDLPTPWLTFPVPDHITKR